MVAFGSCKWCFFGFAWCVQAHGLEEIFNEVPRKRTAYGNTVDYQMIHSLLLVVLGLFGSKNKPGSMLFPECLSSVALHPSFFRQHTSGSSEATGCSS